MPSFADDIVLAILALLLFGPKKLPVLARELGKWVAEFRRASNEFKYQMEEELRLSEQAERQKQIAATEAAATAPPPLHAADSRAASDADAVDHAPSAHEPEASTPGAALDDLDAGRHAASASAFDEPSTTAQPAAPLPIATSGSLSMMPPDTGLPVGRGSGNPMNAVLASIPERAEAAAHVRADLPVREDMHDREEQTLHAD